MIETLHKEFIRNMININNLKFSSLPDILENFVSIKTAYTEFFKEIMHIDLTRPIFSEDSVKKVFTVSHSSCRCIEE